MDSTQTLPELFSASVAEHADRPAVSDPDRTFTYRELDDRSTRLAGRLLSGGLRPGENVGICLDRGVGVVVAMLGVIKAGGAYLSIDAGYPASRRELMVRDGGVRLIVTADGSAADFPEGVQQLGWDADTDADADEAPAPHPVAASSAACVLYTSGSTGTPKGIVFEHRNLVALAGNPDLPSLGPQDKVGQISSISFDGITLEVWGGLAAGAEVVVLPRIGSLLPVDLRQELKRRRVTMMLVPATVLNEVCRVDRDAFSPLRYLCSGGDVILPATCRAMLGGAFRGELYNLYGPSEITTAATAYRIEKVADDAANIPIGTAIEGYETYVVDESMRPVPQGEIGQLLVGGIGVARGYLGDPELTAERFLTNPFGAPDSRLYVTGDRVRENAHGQLEYLGRFDNQVKIRGHRVEPVEVEHALSRHSEVRQAAVLVEEMDSDHRLVAFVVPAIETLSIQDLRSLVSSSLPQHMVPSSISIIDTMPTTGNGKRDRRALAELRQRVVARQRSQVPLCTDTERRLAGLWEKVLNTEDVGATDDFFDVGGNSLLAFRVRMAIVREFGTRVDSHILFEHSTVRALAALLDELAVSGQAVPGQEAEQP